MWKKDRKTLNSAFNTQLFGGFLKIFNNESNCLVEKLEQKIQEGEIQTNFYPMILSATTEIIYRKFEYLFNYKFLIKMFYVYLLF